MTDGPAIATIAPIGEDPAEVAAVSAIAQEHGFVVDGRPERDSIAEAPYRALVRRHGRLLGATVDGTLVGVGGVLLDEPAAMVTDLFLTAAAQGRGVGRALLDALLVGTERRCTAASEHPAALPTYEARGMARVGHVHYVRGVFRAGDPDPASFPVAPIGLDAWGSDRPALAAHFAERGVLLGVSGGGSTVRAVVHVDADRSSVDRLVVSGSTDPVAAIEAVLRWLPADRSTTLCIPPWAPILGWLLAHGFDVFDRDVWCATPTSGPPINDPRLVLHPGLG
jgi:GNAT superfamily N-acetyltransferase